MSNHNDASVIQPDMVIKGSLEAGTGEVVIHGYVEGDVIGDRITVDRGGRVYGTFLAQQAQIDGEVQGTVKVRTLIDIGPTGSVHGDVQYGSISMTEGADLTATVRNVPPTLSGDLDLSVKRGAAVQVTTTDLTALDPDHSGDQLAYHVSNANHGHVARANNPKAGLNTFTQTDIERGEIIFQHDGASGDKASFAVVVADADGATSGAPQTVQISVLA